MTDQQWHIPHPEIQPEFYQDVPLKRLLAWLVDTVLVIVLCVLILPFTAFTGLFFFPLLILVVGFVYRVLTIAQGSATWGMRLFAIEFRTLSGERFETGTAFAHTLLYTLSWAMLPIHLLSMGLMAMTERGQGLADHFLGTVAINRRARA